MLGNENITSDSVMKLLFIPKLCDYVVGRAERTKTL